MTQTPRIQLALIGAAKAGTTSLFRFVEQHPALTGHADREMAFFHDDRQHAKGFNACLKRYYPNASGDAALIAKHVYFMADLAALNRLHQHNADVKLVALLRHPVDRAYSAYHYARKLGREPAATFEDALALEDERAAQPGLPFRVRLYRGNGVYATHLNRVLQRFPREQLLVLFTDELKTDAAWVCRRVFEHAGLEPGFVPDLSVRHNEAGIARNQGLAYAMASVLGARGMLKTVTRMLVPKQLRRGLREKALAMNSSDAPPPPMQAGTRQQLLDHFAPLNAELAELLGKPLPDSWSR